MNAINNILVYVNFTPSSMNAVKTAIAMCKRHNARLYLINVVDNDMIVITGGMNLPIVNVVHGIHASRLKNLNILADTIVKTHKIDCQACVETGFVHKCISDKAIELKVDVIVLAKSSTVPFLGCLFVNTTEWLVLKNAPCPVLTIPASNTATTFRKILFSLTTTNTDYGNYDFIRPIIKCNKSSIFLHGIVNSTSDFHDIKSFVRLAQKDKEAGPSLDGVSYYAGKRIANATIEVAQKQKSELIVVTNNFGKTLSKIFRRNYVQSIIQKATIPVLVV